ncbi:MAG: CPBP family intramembrane metalloprotease [Bacteroidia bacterium]
MKGFKKIVAYLYSYSTSVFPGGKQAKNTIGLLATLSVFLIIAIWFNYEYNFERGILDREQNRSLYFIYNMLYYAVPYLFGAFALSIFKNDWSFWSKGGFWLVLFIFCFSLSLDAWYKWYSIIDVPRQLEYYNRKMTAKVTRALIYVVPIGIYYMLQKNRMKSFFGLTTKGFDKSPYLIMMLIMTPMLIWASFNPDFLRSYPTYNVGVTEKYLEVSPWVTFIPYEALYALTFLALEILFRGFLIYEMEKYLGEKVVIPMVMVYCTLHFGKPMMECISSIFGGFILGVIALRSRSVYGGVWVHIFIALGMDILAFLQEEYFMK